MREVAQLEQQSNYDAAIQMLERGLGYYPGDLTIDRRLLAVGVGGTATVLALTFDIAAYEPFLFLIGAVFVPLVGVFAMRYLTTLRRDVSGWNVSSGERPWLLLP